MAYYIVKYEHNEAGKRFVVRQLLSIIRGNFLGFTERHGNAYLDRMMAKATGKQTMNRPILAPDVFHSDFPNVELREHLKTLCDRENELRRKVFDAKQNLAELLETIERVKTIIGQQSTPAFPYVIRDDASR
jgi:hypothetical protein